MIMMIIMRLMIMISAGYSRSIYPNSIFVLILCLPKLKHRSQRLSSFFPHVNWNVNECMSGSNEKLSIPSSVYRRQRSVVHCQWPVDSFQMSVVNGQRLVLRHQLSGVSGQLLEISCQSQLVYRPIRSFGPFDILTPSSLPRFLLFVMPRSWSLTKLADTQLANNQLIMQGSYS